MKAKTVKEFKNELEEIVRKRPEYADLPIFYGQQTDNCQFIKVNIPELYLRNVPVKSFEKSKAPEIALRDNGNNAPNCLLIHKESKTEQASNKALDEI